MSSTNRGAVREAGDFYPTPDWATDIILPHLRTPKVVLEPASGVGDMAHRVAKHWPRTVVDKLEIDPWRATWCGAWCVDFLKHPVCGSYDLVITNPPFSLAQEFVEQGLRAVNYDGEVAMLLRLAFLESKGRRAFHRTYPSDVYVFSKRPSFKSKGRTDSAAYAWFVWGLGRGNRWSILGDGA